MSRQLALIPVRAAEVPVPASLQGLALHAWTQAVASLGDADLSQADFLSLEVACRAWGRWRALEERIEVASGGNVLAGELQQGADKRLHISPLRQAADAARREFQEAARPFGIGLPAGREEVLPPTDLFGNPDRPGRGQKGRPRFQATPRDRDRVMLMLAAGWSNARIASVLRVSLPTLLKYFRAELAERADMRDRLDARRLELAMEGANGGSVAALKELGRLLEVNDAALADASIRAAQQGRPAEPEEKRRPLGKKEEAALAAETAGQGTEWGDDLDPTAGLGRPN